MPWFCAHLVTFADCDLIEYIRESYRDLKIVRE